MDRVEALYKISLAITSTLDLEEVLKTIMKGIREELSFDRVGIFLVDEKNKKVYGKLGTNAEGQPEEIGYQIFPLIENDNNLADIALGKIDFFYTEDAWKDLRESEKKYLAPKVTQNAVVPLKVKNKILGMIAVDNLVSRRPFGKEELKLLKTFASQTAIAIENANFVERLKELDKLKSDFVSMVSHELQTPLLSISEALSIVQEEKVGSLNPDQKKFIEIGRRNAARLANLIKDILDLSKIEAGRLEIKREKVNFPVLLSEVIKSLEPQLSGKSINLKITFLKDFPEISADQEAIRRVLTNLLDNAMKFMPEGGDLEISGKEKGKEIEISIKDTGLGIAKENLENIFERFWQDKRITKGFGLGLSISKSLIGLQGGKIWAESEGEGKGATFLFTLPKA